MGATKALLTTGVVYLRSLVAGFSTQAYTPGGVVNTNSTSNGNDANTTEKDLATYTLPANSLPQDGDTVRVTAWGTVANNGNTKTIRLYFAGTVVQNYFAGVAANQSWRIEAVITRTGAAAQISVGHILMGSTPQVILLATPAGDTTAGIIIKVTGQSPVTGAANDVVFKGLVVEVLP